VDNISGLGMEYEMDKWGIDITITATQKALGLPPGLSFVALSERAAAKADKAPVRSFYFDYNAYKDYLKKGQPPYTPCISVMVATGYMLGKMKKTGLQKFNAMHARRARAVRSAAEALGLKLFAEEGYRSDTLTAIEHPKSEDIRSELLKRHNIMLGGGQKQLAGKIFRIGNMGDVKRHDFERVFGALAEVLGSDESARAKAIRAFENI
jgi:aspartate aminotransferase-like enzyme